MKPKQARRIARQMQLARSCAKLAAGESYASEVAKRQEVIKKMVAESGGSITDAAFGMAMSIQVHKPRRAQHEQNLIFAAAVELIEGETK